VEARALVPWAALLAATVSCRGPETSLVQDLAAEPDYAVGSYASFLEAPSDRGLVRLSDDSRPSLTPPFPGSLRFALTLPDAAFLSFAPALVARQEVRRAGVEFVVRVDTEVVYQEFFDFEDANQWHDREVDLSEWAGREVALRSPSRQEKRGFERESTPLGRPTRPVRLPANCRLDPPAVRSYTGL